MGKQSNEGYEGGNWPSTTGNPSGGGRGNAEPSGYHDDWDDNDGPVTRAPSIFEIIERNRLEAASREEMRRTPPHVSPHARKLRGKLIYSGFPGNPWIELDIGSGRPLRLRFSDRYADHFVAIQKPYLVDYWIVGDEVAVALNERNEVISYQNVDLTDNRINSEGRYSRHGSYHMNKHRQENDVRSGRSFESIISRHPTKEDIERNKWKPLHLRAPNLGFIETKDANIAWRIVSGDYEIPGIGFRNLKQAKNCLIELIKLGRLCELSRSEFRLQSETFGMGQNAPQIYRCCLANKHGQPPNNWNHGIPMVTTNAGISVPHRNAYRTEYED
ncbi:MAG: hypothetical protein ACX933_10390 [Marinobacter adhaerens]